MIEYPSGQLKVIIKLMQEKQVDLVLAVAGDLESSEGTVKLAETYPNIKAAIGFHPWSATKLDSETKKRFEKLAGSKYVKALGEIGMDFTLPSPEVQKELFIYEVSIAKQYDLPLNIHCMGGAHRDMMSILKANPSLRGIAHSFYGDNEMLMEWLDLGFYIAPALINPTIVRNIPLERLVVETDCIPMNSLNGPVDVILVVQYIASIRGTTAEEIGEATTTNLKRILNI